MNWFRKAVVVLALAPVWAAPGQAVAADGGDGVLWGAVTIAPGREGVVEVAGFGGEGSVLTLTAPGAVRVTGVPLADRDYRGVVGPGGRSGSYTFVGGPAKEPWAGRRFPFVLAVPAGAVPGTRIAGCAMVLADENGAPKARGACAVTVGLPAPTLLRPQSGVPLGARPQTSGTAHPGAQITVRDGLENEVCATTTAGDGTWSCVPDLPLAPGAGLLQATATLNGVTALSDQIAVTVDGP
ncbi:carboxypeptidase regulatory-like domain-containing protein [Streptomyces cinnabarinus]|uniref:Carboxypeptidase regulatory-like domain-containing protein n=1 Tax=Streptomyces cinnabarinus TaxID=67287 RepID=A0ABY7KJ60_9ACTN|nr:carboxypeptidase regulatory-like domain-containing protein [Streptomyces cinnabarinus]WAZ22986.1 carboxypeptidase regulatory-like domain-containing protein [Streptomyces cinnabarinus]